jgi:L-threonylcarbamoyladenylate synthase
VTGGQDTVGLRVPGHPVALALLRAFGSGVAAPSANRFGRVSPTDHRHVLDDLAAFLDPSRDAVIAGGAAAVGVESTIIDCTRPRLRILRHGGITAEEIADVVGDLLDDAQGEVAEPSDGRPQAVVRAPGMLEAHYAPSARVEVVDADRVGSRLRELTGLRVGVLGPADVDAPAAARLDPPHPYDGKALAPILYARFRDADRLELDVLLVVPPTDSGMGVAVRDRLARAAFGSAAAGPASRAARTSGPSVG